MFTKANRTLFTPLTFSKEKGHRNGSRLLAAYRQITP